MQRFLKVLSGRKDREGPGREAVTVLIPVIYCNQPRTMKQNTDTVQDFSLQTSHRLYASTMFTVQPSVNIFVKLVKAFYGTLNF